MVYDPEYYPGKGCECNAWSKTECACGVDWTDSKVYELREKLRLLRKDAELVAEPFLHHDNPRGEAARRILKERKISF